MRRRLIDLGQKTVDEIAQILAAIPGDVTTLDLRWNSLHYKSGDELAQALAAIPGHVTTLYLSWNCLGNKSGAELAQAFEAIPAGVTTLDLSENQLGNKSGTELALAFAAIPAGVKVNYGENELQKKYDIHYLLDSYLERRAAVTEKGRAAVTDSSAKTKEYFYGSFFSVFQKSFTQKKEAVTALKSALSGDSVDLSKHLSTLRNGNLGKELRAFIKSGMGYALVGKEVNSVSDFVQALQEKTFHKVQPF